MSVVLKGADVVKEMNEAMMAQLAARAAAGQDAPKLAIVRVGERADDLAYERGAVKRFANIGLRTEVYAYPADIRQEDFLAAFRQINADPDVHGILVFRPLAPQIDDQLVIETIDPGTDVDGISPANMAKIFAGDSSGFAPCTAAAVMAILDHAGISLKGKRVAVVGRSLVVGKPLSMLLLARDATVTLCHSKTLDLPAVCRESDILVACVGKAKLLGAEYIRPGAVVIDVGINVDEEGGLWGDVDFAAAQSIAGAITPVPGGVGTVTTSMLARQLMKAADIAGVNEVRPS